VEDYRPRGAREVRQAGLAFLEMKRRIERQIEQRTTMLAGVSHDMRTVLTRFKLELALLEDTPEVEALRRDVDEMQRMLEAYLAFARGDISEQPALVDVSEMLEQFAAEAERRGKRASAKFAGPPIVQVRPDSFKRCVANLVANASRYGSTIALSGTREPRWLAKMLDFPNPAEYASETSAGLLYFVRRYCAKLLYELELHAAEDVLTMRSRYVEILGDALKIEPSSANYLADVDAGFYASAYLRSWAFEAQLREYLRERYGSEWFASRKAGGELAELWSEGQKPTAEELLRDVTGAELDLESVGTRVREALV